MRNDYGIPPYLRRKSKAKKPWISERLAREIVTAALGIVVGASIAIAIHVQAAQVPPQSQPAAEEAEPPERTESVKDTARKIVLAHVTAYTSSIDETDEDPGTTASGTTPERGTLACPSKYAFGTAVIINGKTFICEDRMNARYRNTERFDMWVPTKSEAFHWGKKTLKIEIKEA